MKNESEILNLVLAEFVLHHCNEYCLDSGVWWYVHQNLVAFRINFLFRKQHEKQPQQKILKSQYVIVIKMVSILK